MTVIAWDGKFLVTDNKATDGELKWESTKAWMVTNKRFGSCIVSGEGWRQNIIILREWFAAGADPKDFPFKNKVMNCRLIVVTRNDGFLVYEEAPYPVVYDKAAYRAYGEGRDFAFGALEMGASAIDAVKIANKYSQSCGLGYEFFSLEEK